MRKDNMLFFKKDKDGAWKVYYKFYAEGKTKRPSNLWVDLDGNKKAQIELKSIIPDAKFETPKPIQIIKRIQELTADDYSTILDFFAGSGTTLHATMQLNAEDGGHRQCILVMNNENNICEEVTYERKMRLKIYVFSPGRYPFTDNFREVEDKVELVALPAAVYDAYQKVLPKRKEKLFEEEKEQIETKIPADLFEGQGV